LSEEFENEKVDQSLSTIEELSLPSIVAAFVKPENVRRDVMDSFEVIRPLGDGVSSSVLEVEHISTGQRFALKRLQRTQNHSDVVFFSEWKVLSMLKSKGVIRTVDAFADESYYYLLNELGVTDLFKRIKATGRLSEKITKQVVRHLLETLKELHRNNMVHRDIKPDNVVFTEETSNFPKLIDFGDAITVDDKKVYSDFVGTKCYLSPERWRQHYGWQIKASEIWAIGVLTYEMVTGKRCFYASSDRQLAEKIHKGSFKYAESTKPSNLCCHFIRSLLTVEAEHRPTAQFALNHPWLSVCEDQEIQHSLIESWNINVSNRLDWIVYKPNPNLSQ